MVFKVNIIPTPFDKIRHTIIIFPNQNIISHLFIDVKLLK